MFLVFVCRNQRLADDGNPLINLHFTESQTCAIRRLWRQVEDNTYGRAWEDLLLRCLMKLWRGDSEEDFHYLSLDKWKEPTLVFGLLNCLERNGKFQAPRECSRYFNRIKYCMRLTMLSWCLIRSLQEEHPVASYVFQLVPLK
jgi:hypothetical protein